MTRECPARERKPRHETTQGCGGRQTHALDEAEEQVKLSIDAIALRDTDNVATALRDLPAGEEVVVGIQDRSVRVRVGQPIAFGHKLALSDIARGEPILKYGEVIGRATQAIPAGCHAHVHNIESLRGRGDLEGKGAGHGV